MEPLTSHFARAIVKDHGDMEKYWGGGGGIGGAIQWLQSVITHFIEKRIEQMPHFAFVTNILSKSKEALNIC